MPRKRTDTSGKRLGLDRALAWRRSRARAGETVVFTNGVFDILHPGHVQLLEQSAALGDRLIVGVNSDASARRLGKSGPKRPVNKLADRARVLSALACVDAVVSFGEDTPEKLLSRLKPDVLVKGADYKIEEVAGREHAKRVALLRLKRGYSTTGLLRRLAR
jgi:D-beta-D-heptose 7-phosphate kinase/D-beta-D-heptose 1-phosphate adenosyltransferase